MTFNLRRTKQFAKHAFRAPVQRFYFALRLVRNSRESGRFIGRTTQRMRVLPANNRHVVEWVDLQIGRIQPSYRFHSLGSFRIRCGLSSPSIIDKQSSQLFLPIMVKRSRVSILVTTIAPDRRLGESCTLDGLDHGVMERLEVVRVVGFPPNDEAGR